MSNLFSDQEKADIQEVLGDWLGTNDIHDVMVEQVEFTAEEMAIFSAFYHRIANLYYTFTGHDYLCGHGFITSFNEGRKAYG